MVKVVVEKVEYKLCEKCGVFRNPESFKAKKKIRKSCSICRIRK